MSGAASQAQAAGQTCRIGVDIGGTFTDIVLIRSDGRLFVLKASSSTREPEQAVVAGVAAILDLAGLPPAAAREVLHGTTVGSNTILQKSGARTGLITTRGFRDVLEIGRVRTPDLFDLQWDKPEPLVRRRHRMEVRERLHADGSVATALDEEDVARAADALVADQVEAIALCFLHSYRNAEHERRAAELVRARHPGVAVCASIDILPEMKEYERTSTTVVNAYILPTMRRYLERLQSGLETLGVDCPLLVVTSNGGLARAPLALERPVFFIGSGPAAGVVGAARLAVAAGCADAIAFDMGGTTAKASLIDRGAVARTNEYEFRAGISTPSRFIKAGGYMLKVPAVDVAEVGAGAGSIAWVDPAGLLHVGPQSAGGDPGPACYGKGGDRPTVSDANVVLGMLNPDHLAGGALPIHRDLAVAAIERDVARPLGVDVMQAALGIRSVANASMARAVRSVTVERGIDPRDFTLVAFGGSGPVHAADLARGLAMPRVLFPNLPGVFTAGGMLAGDVERHFVTALPGPIEALAGAEARRAIAEMRDAARTALAQEGFAGELATVRLEADLRLAGQDSEISVPFAAGECSVDGAAAIANRFYEAYEQMYRYRVDEPVELANLRAVAIGRRPERLDFAAASTATSEGTAPQPRPVRFEGSAGGIEVAVVTREAVGAGWRSGPLIIESYDTTIVAPPGSRVRADELGNIVMELGR